MGHRRPWWSSWSHSKPLVHYFQYPPAVIHSSSVARRRADVAAGRASLFALVADPGLEAFAAAMQTFRADAFNPAAIRAHAETFGTARFETAFRTAVADALAVRP